MTGPIRKCLAILLAAFAIMAAVESSRAQETLKPGDTISGRLRFFKHQHPNGTWINVYQITADNPRKFAEADEFCDPDKPPKTFHLVVMDDKAKARRLDRLIGKTVAVVGESFFCSQTAWHIGDAVVFKWHFVEPSRADEALKRVCFRLKHCRTHDALPLPWGERVGVRGQVTLDRL